MEVVVDEDSVPECCCCWYPKKKGGGSMEGGVVGSVPPVAPPTVKLKWAEHLTTSWLLKDCQPIAQRDSTLVLYDRLLENKVMCS